MKSVHNPQNIPLCSFTFSPKESIDIPILFGSGDGRLCCWEGRTGHTPPKSRDMPQQGPELLDILTNYWFLHTIKVIHQEPSTQKHKKAAGATDLCRFLFFRFLWLLWWLPDEVEDAAFWGFTPCTDPSSSSASSWLGSFS